MGHAVLAFSVMSLGSETSHRERDDSFTVCSLDAITLSGEQNPGNLALHVNRGGGRLLIYASIWINSLT